MMMNGEAKQISPFLLCLPPSLSCPSPPFPQRLALLQPPSPTLLSLMHFGVLMKNRPWSGRRDGGGELQNVCSLKSHFVRLCEEQKAIGHEQSFDGGRDVGVVIVFLFFLNNCLHSAVG